MSETYCDNDLLKELILDAKPSNSGLYPHEIVMIIRTKYGKAKTRNNVFLGIYEYSLHVHHPQLMLDSLVNRGYLREANKNELLRFAPVADLRKVIKTKNLKCKGKSSRENIAELILNNFSYDEVINLLGYNLILPTKKGDKEIEENSYLVENQYTAWQVNSGYRSKKSVDNKSVKIDKLKEQTLSISSADSAFLLNKVLIKSRFENMYNCEKLNVIVDNQVVSIIRNPVEIIPLRKTAKLIVISGTEGSYEYVGIDLVSKKIIFKEEFQYKIYNLGSQTWESRFDRFKRYSTKNRVVDDNKLNLYFSVNNDIGLILLENIFREEVEIKNVKNILPEDATRNIQITIDIENFYLRNLLLYLDEIGILSGPKIKGCSVNDLFFLYRLKRDSQSEIIANDEVLENFKTELAVKKFLMTNYITDYHEFENRVIDIFPYETLFQNKIEYILMHALDERSSKKIKGEYHTFNWRKKWEEEVSKLIFKLKEEKLIPPQFINEFALYLLTKNYLPDAVFQYRTLWLNRQSLDIYIPSKKIGIEYQGEQHYRPIEFFGGVEAFEYRLMLDERKRKLCKKNNITLIEWSFEKEVNTKNFLIMIKKHGVKLLK